MEAEETIFADHDREVAAIRGRLQEALLSPQPAAMIHPRFAGMLFRQQKATAERLGKGADDPSLAARFGAEEAALKKMCGL